MSLATLEELRGIPRYQKGNCPSKNPYPPTHPIYLLHPSFTLNPNAYSPQPPHSLLLPSSDTTTTPTPNLKRPRNLHHRHELSPSFASSSYLRTVLSLVALSRHHRSSEKHMVHDGIPKSTLTSPLSSHKLANLIVRRQLSNYSL
ncbi:hypothetical protein RND81_08G150300 [Saponaria officinalis]|uniref:Uncharacterized protein n=1 Tax=Saponaria officinalis TaxID=3572 RepID=A0AAW1J7R6_SAPOF